MFKYWQVDERLHSKAVGICEWSPACVSGSFHSAAEHQLSLCKAPLDFAFPFLPGGALHNCQGYVQGILSSQVSIPWYVD